MIGLDVKAKFGDNNLVITLADYSPNDEGVAHIGLEIYQSLKTIQGDEKPKPEVDYYEGQPNITLLFPRGNVESIDKVIKLLNIARQEIANGLETTLPKV